MTTSEEKSTAIGLKMLKISRGGHHAYTTKIIKESEGLLAMEISKEIQDELVTNCRILQDKMAEFKEMDRRIAELTEDDKEFETELMDTGDYNRLVLKTIVAITRLIDGNTSKPAAPVSTQKPHTRLEKLKLKSYDGDPLQYISFWDCFESAVHNDSSLG